MNPSSAAFLIANQAALASPNKGSVFSNYSIHASISFPLWSLATTTTETLSSLIATSKFSFIQFKGGGVQDESLGGIVD